MWESETLLSFEVSTILKVQYFKAKHFKSRELTPNEDFQPLPLKVHDIAIPSLRFL
jgi:hypothetical protein